MSVAFLPLRYLIGITDAAGVVGTITEVSYDSTELPVGVGAHYVNLRDENDTGLYPPYLPPDDIDSEYNEPAPDPSGPGFWINLRHQLDAARRNNFVFVELDNLDTYDTTVALKCFDVCADYGLKVFVKNPLQVAPHAHRLLAHPAAALVIVEEDCGGPNAMNKSREDAGKPDMPIRFVSYGASGQVWAERTAAIIRENHYLDMGVTHSPAGEYESTHDVLLPIGGAQPMKKIVISSGHGKYIRGASGYPVPPQLDEVDEARRVVERTADYLRSAGIDATTFHDDVSNDQSENLNRIVNFHNAQGPHDLDVSVHFNAYDGNAHGVECLYVTQETLSRNVANALAQAGKFTNRGPKYRGDLFFLNNTNEPAILVETCFCDNTSDSNLYNEHFDAICQGLAETIAGEEIDAPPDRPDRPERPERPEDPTDVPIEQRPTLGVGDEGPDVEDLQKLLNGTELDPDLDVDGDFGGMTEEAVYAYQASRGLDYDGICGDETWGALYENKPPLPPPPHALTEQQIEAICRIANNSAIADYYWDDRGAAPVGYTQGMALAFAQTMKKLEQDHPAAVEMSKARTNSDKDALNIYRDAYTQLGMSNEEDGIATLRHLYALMLGHGMRESSGRHCEGRDMSASNVQSDTAEAGLFQTSYNAHSASDPEFGALMGEYSTPANKAACYLTAFDDGVSCSNEDWSCYGSGSGYQFQKLCKECPAFAVETCGLTLRNLANHYGPIIRGETELKREADEMFQQVQDYMESVA
jgi:N-acetylmuramoyl-L-alanine amidase/peptidoglycan hydrolase-like protein with peptidoglycan-binding domain